MAGTLFIVATPIGNLEDITFRAVRILAEVDLIAAEDTRRTKILLTKYSINTPLTSYHKFNIKAKTQSLIDLIKQGQNLALVSDSGMPGVSDPGHEIIRASADQDIRVEVIPGPSAAISALVVSGLPTDKFIFTGFLPKKPGKKKKALARLKDTGATVIIYESPFRVIKTIQEIKELFGDRQIALCRELTKKFEETKRGRAEDILESFKKQRPRGEFIIVV